MHTEDSNRVAVVVADNQETVLRSVSSTLEKAGFTVLATSSGAEALQYCSQSSQPVNLAVIDSDAVGVNASELARQLEAVSPRTRTLFLTAGSDEQPFRTTPHAKHASGVLQKPFRRSQLLGHVLEMLDQPKVLTA